MPITNIGSHISTAGDFVAHWTDVNTDRLAAALTELSLTGGYSLTDLLSDRDGLQTQAACYEAFFRTAWSRPWVAGAYFWKWFPDHERVGGEGGGVGFTPQRRPAQETLSKWYRRSFVGTHGDGSATVDEPVTTGGE